VSPFDVNLDGAITPQDVAVQIGNVNAGQAVPLDVLTIINYINVNGNNTPAEYPIVGVLPAQDTLGRIQYDATRPTAVEITVFSMWLPIENAVLIDSDGNETPGVWSRPGTGFERWTFRPVVDGTGVLTLHGTIDSGATQIWGMTRFWDEVKDRPTVRGLDLARIT
jgi:hypothetical protein